MKFAQLFATTSLVAAIATAPAMAAEMLATQTDETINGLKVYTLELIDDYGLTIDTVRAVSGRAGKQMPSDRAGSQTPLPFGVYRFEAPGRVIRMGGEFGGVWSAIAPEFSTGRSGLGLHHDPSAFNKNGQAGTAGCLATPTVAERDIVTAFIRTHRPTRLTVEKFSGFNPLPIADQLHEEDKFQLSPIVPQPQRETDFGTWQIDEQLHLEDRLGFARAKEETFKLSPIVSQLQRETDFSTWQIDE